jgi:hypoxanthine phosphoribosyltransferase
MEGDVCEVLVSEAAIKQRISELGREISDFYKDEELFILWIMNGALLFTADLIRNITIPVRVDCIRVDNRRETLDHVYQLDLRWNMNLNIEDQCVLLVDDIYDTGKTLQRVVKSLKQFRPKSIETCVLLDKQTDRAILESPNYVGFQIQDQFVVGYGLDFAQRYRHLPYIGVLHPELQNPPEWV